MLTFYLCNIVKDVRNKFYSVFSLYIMKQNNLILYDYYSYRYTVNWLQRGSQVPLLEGIVGRAQERVSSLRPDIRTSSITDDNIWLPVGPDRRY